MMKRIPNLIGLTLLVFAFILSCPVKSLASGESAAEFYKKNTITMVIATKAGGGSDFGARLIANYWNQVTGGTMIVKNMPGAGGILGINYTNASKPDGLTLGIMMWADGYLLPYLTKNHAAKYDLKKMNFVVGGFTEPWGVIVSSKRPYNTIKDLQDAKGLKLSTQTPYSIDTFVSIPFFDFLNLDVKIVSGYKSGADKTLALGKGEVDMEMAPLANIFRGVEAGFCKPPLCVMTTERVSLLPDTPAFTEFVKMTPDQKKVFDASVNSVGRIVRVASLPPGVPQDRVNFLRETFATIMNLPDLAEKSKSAFPMGPTPLVKEDLDKFVAESLETNIDDLKHRLDKYINAK